MPSLINDSVTELFKNYCPYLCLLGAYIKRTSAGGHNNEVSKTHQGYSVPNLPLSVPRYVPYPVLCYQPHSSNHAFF